MTIKAMIREVLRMVGNPSGGAVSKEYLLMVINEEAQQVAARFPNTQRVGYTPLSQSQTFPLADLVAGEGMSVKRVMVNNVEIEMITAERIERMVAE